MKNCVNYVIMFWMLSIVKGQLVVNKCINRRVTLDCSAQKHCFVRIVSAYYGHPAKNRPSSNCTFAIGHCMTNATDVWSRCNRNRKCEFYVRQSRDQVRAVCSTVSEYLTVTYECTCTVPCELLPPVENAQIKYSTDDLEYGTIAIYSCNEQFKLRGPKERQCTMQGNWAHIQPVCSVPLSSCRSTRGTNLASIQTTYKYVCLELSERSFTWNETNYLCTEHGALLLNISSKEKNDFIGWWLDELEVQGFIWTSGTSNIGDDLCLELFKDVETDGHWRQRAAQCFLRNHYICEYGTTTLTRVEQNEGKLALALALGLGIGLTLLLIIITIITILIIRNRRRKMEDNVTIIPQTPSTSSCNLAEQEYIYNNETHSDSLSNNNTTRTLPETQSPGCSTESTYDDVCLPPRTRMDSGTPLGEPSTSGLGNGGVKPRIKPPIKRKPRLAGARLYTKHTYENVALHNLTESLKRKFLPRRSSSAKSDIKRQKHIVETNLSIVPSTTNNNKDCDCSKCPVPPKRTVSNESNTQFKNGKCKFCGKRSFHFKTQDESSENGVQYSTVLVTPGKRRSSGLRLVENDLYNSQVSETAA